MLCVILCRIKHLIIDILAILKGVLALYELVVVYLNDCNLVLCVNVVIIEELCADKCITLETVF
jgi:hypothetical protein